MRPQYTQKTLERTMFLYIFLVSLATISAYPATMDEDRLVEFMSPGAHKLANWISYQLRKNDYLQSPELPTLYYRLSGNQGKRNSELTNSMMGIPRNMIDNGKK